MSLRECVGNLNRRKYCLKCGLVFYLASWVVFDNFNFCSQKCYEKLAPKKNPLPTSPVNSMT